MRHALVAAVIAMLLSGTQTAAAQQFVDVRLVATDTLRDVAVTVTGPGRPTIYYSPIRMQQIGPTLSAFAMAHEYGHVRYGHTGGALGAGVGVGTAELRLRQELEADCYAARILSETDPEAVSGAVNFFNGMGPFRFDSFHPAGSQRAAKILSCIPGPTAPEAPTAQSSTGR